MKPVWLLVVSESVGPQVWGRVPAAAAAGAMQDTDDEGKDEDGDIRGRGRERAENRQRALGTCSPHRPRHLAWTALDRTACPRLAAGSPSTLAEPWP